MKKKSLHNFLDYTGYFQYKKDYYEFKMKDAEIVKPLNYLRPIIQLSTIYSKRFSGKNIK